MLRFEHPDLLWLLLAVPLLLAAFIALHVWNGRLMERFVSEVLWPSVIPGASGGKRGIKRACVLFGIAFLVLAMANPQVGTKLEEVKREGIDMFVALDVSLSMKAEDIKPSRLEKAKRDVSALLRKLAGDRVGLIVFAGDAFVQFPLTADYAAADLFISTVDVESVPTPGTMIASAIERALESFMKDSPTQKAIVIVTDGENTEGDVLGAVDKAKESGVKVYTIGMGTIEGGPIPIAGPGGAVDYKRDGGGSVVVTKLDESMLQQIAAATGGTYHRASSGGSEMDKVFEEISKLEKTEFASKQVSGYESRYQIPLALAILFFLIEPLVSERRGRILAAFRRLMPAAAVLAVFVLPNGAEAQTVRGHVKDGNKLYDRGKYADAEVEYRKAAEKDPTSPVTHFNLGDAHYKQDRFEEAVRSFSNSALNAESGTDKGAGFYNMGNAFARENRFDEAIEAYKRALRHNPDDEDARYNLSVVRNKKQQQQQQQQNQKNKDKQQQQQQQQDQQGKDKKEQEQKQGQEQENKQQQAQQDKTREAQRKNQMPKDEAERMLEAMRNNEKLIQKKLQKREGVKVRVERDW
ncbi:MAG: hypothetical protein A3H45_13675 [Ignavibacteria bacterium RIFCSPLOWO2_02_FULL_55_14]|nr:MAG: hypothetical protein A2X68_00965 [Ignavibacteria bacterium GWC2_56_12]OGU65529.1 MAG: hypothetical protein A3C56_01210 [Ignavibacteria bacterium RIFCSPHIGHO2_02_FULL_56_12]OGU74801.1 MAG: hypothetical protein A3H45_13675 [Ignavibacteria bacterium RIFCSPLOWO2_02_FULL_55_14]OGU75068.1 MAG: hypothetical protein A3G43_11415 [Ignavibacteria bacterium RIFCSPLOWO2_12_FULL_56_21]